MDISTLEDNLKKGKYTKKPAFVADIQLICDNARLFNKPNSVYAKNAIRLEKSIAPKIRLLKESDWWLNI